MCVMINVHFTGGGYMRDMGNPILGRKLRNLRKQFKMTQDDVAFILNMSRSSFSKYETGMSNPPLPVLRKLANIYNVGLEYLIFDENVRIEMNDPQNEDESNSEMPFSQITDLRAEEKQIIGKFRTMSDDEKKELMKQLFSDRKDEE